MRKIDLVTILICKISFECVSLFGFNFYFICITDIITKQYNNSEIHVQTLYKWDSEGSQMTYLNLYPKHVERHSVRKLLAIVVMFK